MAFESRMDQSSNSFLIVTRGVQTVWYRAKCSRNGIDIECKFRYIQKEEKKDSRRGWKTNESSKNSIFQILKRISKFLVEIFASIKTNLRWYHQAKLSLFNIIPYLNSTSFQESRSFINLSVQNIYHIERDAFDRGKIFTRRVLTKIFSFSEVALRINTRVIFAACEKY